MSEEKSAKGSVKKTVKKKYLDTHPWINFEINLNKFDSELWMLLGEAKSKCEHIAGMPLKPENAEELHRVYLYKGVLATTAIEGNTLTEEEIKNLIEDDLQLPPSREYQGQEVKNIIKSFNTIRDRIMEGHGDKVIVENLKLFNEFVLEGLKVGEQVVPGKVRGHSVVVGRYRAAPAEDCKYLLKKLCDWLNSSEWEYVSRIMNVVSAGLIKAIIAHLYIAWIHPFGDGNGRTARLLELQILLNSNIPTPAAQLLSNHYNLTRSEYYRHLDNSSKKNDIVSFIKYALRGFVDGLAEQISKIQEQILDVSWENYIYEIFRDKDTEAQRRRRKLILDISKWPIPLEIKALKKISPGIAEQYAQKSFRTVRNDFMELIKLDLISFREDGRFEANRNKILAFLPFKKTAASRKT